MFQSKKILISGALALSLLVPALSQAAGLTEVQLNAVSTLLRSFGVASSTVDTIRGTLDDVTIDTSPDVTKAETKACVRLLRDLTVGSQGDDVKKLQERLAEEDDADFKIPATGFFGPMTMKAVKKFQEKFGVSPLGTGFVGPMTRHFFDTQCGKEEKSKDVKDEKVSAAVVGTIVSFDAPTLVIKSNRGDERTVTLTSSTTIKVFTSSSTPATTGDESDLDAGKRVMAEGTKNADGSITAVRVHVGMLPMVLTGRTDERALPALDSRGKGHGSDDTTDDTDEDTSDDN